MSRIDALDARRRAFLKATGIGAGLVPLLGVSRALQAAPFPKRLVVVGSPNAWVHDTFVPKGAGGPLSGITLPAGTSPLEPHKSDVVILPGLEYRNYKAFYAADVDYVDCHHSLPHLLTGRIGVRGQNSSSRPQDGASGYRPAGGGPSLDQWYADKLTAAGTKLPYPCLTVGVKDEDCCEPTMVQMSYRGSDQPNAIENDPFRLNGRLFANVGMNAAELERIRKEGKSILDYVGHAIEGFSKNLGREDRERVMQHLDSVRRVETNLAAANGGMSCAKPDLGAAVDVKSNANIPRLITAQIDNLAAAMACDVTRAATFWLGNGGGNWFPQWINKGEFNGPALAGNAGSDRNHHDLAHASGDNAEARRLKTLLETWFMQQFAALITRFKAVKEGTGTMLDNTIILWVNNMGTGLHSWRHNVWVTAGGRNLGWKTGQYLPQGQWASKGLNGTCVPQNGVLLAIANALTDGGGAAFGDPQFGGEIAGLRA